MSIVVTPIPITSLAHSQLTGVTSGQHHAALTNHSELSGVTSSQHHTLFAPQTRVLTGVRLASAGSGAQTITGFGAGFTPVGFIMQLTGTAQTVFFSIGMGDDEQDSYVHRKGAAATPGISSIQSDKVAFYDTNAAATMSAVVTSYDDDELVITWTAASGGVNVTFMIYAVG